MGWLGQVRKDGNGDLERVPLRSEDQFAEFLLMGMRLNEGVDLQRYPDAASDILYRNINTLTDIGMISLKDSRLKVTPRGRPVLNAVLRGLLDG